MTLLGIDWGSGTYVCRGDELISGLAGKYIERTQPEVYTERDVADDFCVLLPGPGSLTLGGDGEHIEINQTAGGFWNSVDVSSITITGSMTWADLRVDFLDWDKKKE